MLLSLGSSAVIYYSTDLKTDSYGYGRLVGLANTYFLIERTLDIQTEHVFPFLTLEDKKDMPTYVVQVINGVDEH